MRNVRINVMDNIMYVQKLVYEEVYVMAYN